MSTRCPKQTYLGTKNPFLAVLNLPERFSDEKNAFGNRPKNSPKKSKTFTFRAVWKQTTGQTNPEIPHFGTLNPLAMVSGRHNNVFCEKIVFAIFYYFFQVTKTASQIRHDPTRFNHQTSTTKDELGYATAPRPLQLLFWEIYAGLRFVHCAHHRNAIRN